MTDDTVTDDDLGLSPEAAQALDPNIRAQLKRARAAERERDEAVGRAQAAERTLAFTKAGIPDSPMGRYFTKGYEGEMTPEAIQAEARSAGLIGDAQQSGDPAQQPDPDLEAQRRLAQAGGQPAPAPDAGSDYVRAVRAAGSPEEVMAAIQQHGQSVGVGRAGIT